MECESTFYRRVGKRWLDLILGSVALLAALPMLAILAFAVRRLIGRPILFRQLRPGKRGQLFCLYKFRTMIDAIDSRGTQLSDAERLTPFGRWLRATSLDELPEFWNVLRGDMSLVGPRPLLQEYLARYTPEQARRHDVRPGITGLAQVSGRNAISWTEKFDADLQYVDHCSFWLDLKILGRTVGAVLRRRGITAAAHATMPVFTGGEQGDAMQPQMARSDAACLDAGRRPLAA